ncbi:MAG: hypothetical protein O2971_11320 [Proteobacteria bacterium]|nr:hypothetical protein [Pseudomonadota bacterium]
MRRTWLTSAIVVMVVTNSGGGVAAQSSLTPPLLESAEASFRYITSTLQTFRTTGRLVNNPGIDGADLEAFIEVLETYYGEFSRGFNSDSAMCRFYRDPENGRMTIEEKAELSFSFLAGLEYRRDRYIAVDAEFQQTIVTEFGSILLSNINERKVASTSNQQLPAAEFDEAATINFIDSVCM